MGSVDYQGVTPEQIEKLVSKMKSQEIEADIGKMCACYCKKDLCFF